MSNKYIPTEGLYSISEEVSSDAQISRRDRNRFLIGFVALESLTGLAKVLGVNIPLAVFEIEAGTALLPAAMCEISRRLSIRQSEDFREGARIGVKLDMLNERKWQQTLQEPRNTD